MPSSLRNAPPPPSPAAAPKAGLTVSKVIAGAGAAATSAVAGSAFGADGTVVGAAVGSVVSAVAAVAYERSLDRTRQVVVSRVRLPNGRTADVTQLIPADVTQVIPAQRSAAGARPATPVAPVQPPRRTRLPLLAGATALIFLVGLLAVTGIELLAGGPVLSSHQGGTSARESAGGRRRFWFPDDHDRFAVRNHNELSDWYRLVGHADDGRAGESCRTRRG